MISTLSISATIVPPRRHNLCISFSQLLIFLHQHQPKQCHRCSREQINCKASPSLEAALPAFSDCCRKDFGSAIDFCPADEQIKIHIQIQTTNQMQIHIEIWNQKKTQKQQLLGIVVPEMPHFSEMLLNSVEPAPRLEVLRLAEGLNSWVIVGRSFLLAQRVSF